MTIGANSWQYRTHNRYNDTPDFDYVKESSSPNRFQMDSIRSGYGFGWLFKVFSTADILGRTIKVTWQATHDTGVLGSQNTVTFYIYDGSYDRTSNTDFPTNADIPIKGAGQLSSTIKSVPFASTTDTITPDVSGSTQGNVTLFILTNDAWATNYNHYTWISTIEIVGLAQYTFDSSQVITSEATGTGAYGYVDGTYVNENPPPPPKWLRMDMGKGMSM